ncbi:nucleotide exchange factor GrpE [Fodinicola acaciae]|uniref:nucleotide exchange factor GrpE n=1 Tax=Fodinicola acaciae TaxID=2681555 RepID=UPI0013D5C1AA|nr:nucleotide exchange factor GrpE [Fodinicola acaciae]
MTSPEGREPEAEEPRVVVRDRRRIDPETGQPRRPSPGPTAATSKQPAGGPPAGEQPADEPSAGQETAADEPARADVEVEGVRKQLEERTADLQRVTAEYANYRRRVERDRAVAGEQATAAVLTALLPVIDDIDRAREHGDLTGAFAAVAEKLQATLAKAGLVAFGEKGDPFDPNRHEAVMHSESADVTEPTCVRVFRPGYLLGERLVRAAMVEVADPAAPAAAPADPVAGPDPDAAVPAADEE